MGSQNFKERKRFFYLIKLRAQEKMFRLCMDVYLLYEGIYYDILFENSSEIKNRKLKIKKILMEE